MDRRNFVRIVGGGVVLAAGVGLTACSGELPPEATAAWRGPGPWVAGSDVRRWILAHAILAPHSHNLQSWLVDLRQPDEIMLFCDRTRLLPETDPLSRQIMMSQGTFLELLVQAARERGLRAEIDLFPMGEFDPKDRGDRPTARVRLVPDAGARPDPLFGQVFRRHTNRQRYDARVPEVTAVEKIVAATTGPDDSLRLRVGVARSGDVAMDEHRAIAREAWRIEMVTPRTVLESLKVLRVGPKEIAQHRDGLSLNEPLPRILLALGLFDRSRAPGPQDMATTQQIREFDAKIEATPAFFWMVTEGNDRRTQVNAGRAYVRAQLAAAALDLAMHPLQQALQEYPEQAVPYASIHRLLGAPVPRETVQMWARLGHALPVGPAPRRGLDAHILKV